MKTLTQLIEGTYAEKRRKKWDKIYWLIDLHQTIITGDYNRFNTGSKIYPHAKEVLDFLFNSHDNVTIIWTSSYLDSMRDVTNRFDLKFDYNGENPECANTELCDFSQKPYFNIVLDDKGGFDGNVDWEEIREALRKEYGNCL
jgi:hypothetical protein